MAVACAEMIFKEQGMGADKKEYVVNFLNDMFNKNKIVITEEQINILVESAVKEMKMNENK
jgi:LL-H family phage holin